MNALFKKEPNKLNNLKLIPTLSPLFKNTYKTKIKL